MFKSVNIGFLYGMVIGLTIGLFKLPFKIVSLVMEYQFHKM
ncbi:hypothetical protein [Gottfriedia acidiceleris]|nr:hypothetical protein [Gottfriedia acidiceleris]